MPRNRRRLRVVSNGAAQERPFVSEGRPTDPRPPMSWGALLVRLVALGWGGAIVAALVDGYGQLSNLPFLTAVAMTTLLVAAAFLFTHNGRVPDWRGDAIEPKRSESDADDVTDLLTQLPTFAHFQRRLGEEFTRSRRMGKQVSVVLIDVNNLTAVNKEYGVAAGDEVLRHVARTAEGTRRYNDLVSRLGDDEFGVLLMDCGEEGVRAFIQRLEERLSRESALAEVGGRMISLWAGVCTGTSTSAPAMSASVAVLEAAMASLNAAKQDRERRRRMWLSA